MPSQDRPAVFLTRAEVAARIGVSPNTIQHYKLPVPDAKIGRVSGWLPETVDAWNEARPGRGNWRQ